MSRLLEALRRHAACSPAHAAIEDAHGTLTYAELLALVEELARRLRQARTRVVGILADNGRGWVLADLAAHVAQVPVVPLPAFFSPAQIAHVVRTAGIGCILTDDAATIEAALDGVVLTKRASHSDLVAAYLPADAVRGTRLPDGTQKVTFTSGTTGEPKGVCLGIEELETTAESLREVSAAATSDRHLCVLPLATLLENIAGVYTPLLAGATLCVPRLGTIGWSGSSSLDTTQLIAALERWEASSAIMVPQMLQAVVAAGHAGLPMPRRLRYVAVGGAPVAPRLLLDALTLGLPVHEGYGLSECASVVAVNRPGDVRVGSVGRPLPHVTVSFADDGEILVAGMRWRGYLGETADAETSAAIATGDLGFVDADGYLHITGRKKNIFITSFGRNIAPEWIERELVSRAPILQAAVFGEARPFNTAVIVSHPSAPPEAIARVLEEVNQRLPDYARVATWIPAQEAFTPRNGLSTPNGRLRRTAIFGAYADRINAFYQP
jgi:long-subunit acyl-CoA synthetase (AMP-forming)